MIKNEYGVTFDPRAALETHPLAEQVIADSSVPAVAKNIYGSLEIHIPESKNASADEYLRLFILHLQGIGMLPRDYQVPGVKAANPVKANKRRDPRKANK